MDSILPAFFLSLCSAGFAAGIQSANAGFAAGAPSGNAGFVAGVQSANAGFAAGAPSPAPGFWAVSQDSGGRWWAVAPDGSPTFLRGVDHANWNGHWCEALKTMPYRDENAKRFGGDKAAWADETLQRLRDWGFNALGAGCSAELQNRGLAHTVQLEMGQKFCRLGPDHELSHFEGRPGTAFPNVRHPDWPAFCDKRAAEICAAQKDNPDLFGYFFDNELSWRGRTAEEAALYFGTIAEAVRRHDPNHLLLGCRFAGMGGKRFVWEEAGKICDVLTFNNYPWADLDRNVVFQSRNSDVRFADAVAERHAWCGRPLLITEWSFPALDSGLPCSNGAGQRFRTQAERTAATELMARTLLSLPFMVGYDYFMWVDEPAPGISFNFPEDSNYGLVNERGEPYGELVAMFARLHRDIGALHRVPLPPERIAPPSAEPPRTAEEALSRLMAGANAGFVAGAPSPADYTLRTASGLALTGRIGGRHLFPSVKFGGVEYGPFTAMLYHGSWQDVEKAVSAEWDESRGALRVSGEGRDGDKAWRITCEFLPVCSARRDGPPYQEGSPHGGGSGGARAPAACVLVSVVSVENIGAVPLENCSAWLRQYPSWAVEKLTGGFRTAINVWKQPDAHVWMRGSDGAWCGAASTSPLVTNFHYWITAADKAAHPDASFAPPGGIDLAPGEKWDAQGLAWYVAGFGTGGADGWRAFLDAVSR